MVRDRLFWLTSIDRTRQRGVAEINPNNLDLTAFAGLKKEPFDILLQTHKLDWNAGQRQRMNLRYSRDGNAARAPSSSRCASALENHESSGDTAGRGRRYMIHCFRGPRSGPRPVTAPAARPSSRTRWRR